MHIVSGETLKRLLEIFKERFAKGEFSPDFEFDQAKFGGIYEKRRRNQYEHVFTASYGIPREDKAGRKVVYDDNMIGYGAPHMAFLFMSSVPNHDVNVAADTGMYSQSFMLSCTAHGFGSIAQLALALFADDVRRELGISSEFKLLHAISLGRPDWDAMQNKKHLGRVSLDESVVMHR